MRLSALLEGCLRGPYVHTREGGDFRLTREGGRLFIFLPHSDGAEDWKNNLDFPVTRFGEGEGRLWVHRGFLRVWRAGAPHVLPAVCDGRTRSVVIAGYSHGAALALLCFAECLCLRPALGAELCGYGFGAPRVLWGLGRKRARERFARFTVVRNTGDAVTHLPPACLGYFHTGQLLTVGERGKYSPIDAHRPESILAELRNAEK